MGLLENIRNIGIMAHIDAGKTTISERILYYTGKTYKMGEVHDGTTVMDYLEEEQRRGITITSAATKCPWKGYDINLIDTPGHIDFTAEVERSLRVLDGAVAVFDASEWVQAQSETVWRQGQKYALPCLCFINKMDKTGADFVMSVESIREKLAANPIVLQIPMGADNTFSGVIDLITMQAILYEAETLGEDFKEVEIPSQWRQQAEHCRAQLIEAAAEHDEELMDCFAHDKAPAQETIIRAVRKGTLANKLYPVFCGSALKYVGVQRLLDAIVAYLPSPLDRPVIFGHKPADQSKQIPVKCDPDGPLVALAFKITTDAHGDLSYLRIYRGTLKAGTRVLNANRDKRENITRLYEMHADERIALESTSAGSIVAVIGLKQTLTGDTICDTKHTVELPNITFPETVITMSVEPRTAADRAKLTESLEALRREDPTFKYRIDSETGQTVMSGMGELHLEILQHKLVKEKKVNVRVGRPKVAYKEAITTSAQAEGKFIHQTGGHGQYGHVVLVVEPLYTEEGRWSPEIEFEAAVGGDAVPAQYVASAKRGAKEACSSGVLAGYPVVGIRITLIDGSYHSVDSSDLAFEQAAALAMEKGMKAAGPVLLEPIMRLQAIVPEANLGAVQSNLLGKRGSITGCKVHGKMRVIDGKVPLVEMFGYSSEIRSLTAGRGTFTLEPLSYEQVPAQIAKEILV